MERWKKITYMTAVYMFLIEMRPVEPYISAYLTGPNGNVSLSELAYVIEAIKGYTALIVSIFMLVTADYLLYKPNLIFLTSWSCCSYYMITGWPSLMQVRVSAAGIGAMYCSNILAYCYLYAQIEDVNQLQMSTCIVTVAIQLGKVTGDLSAQLIIDATGGSYTLLPYVTAFTMFLAIIWVSLFPPVQQKNRLLNTIVQDEKSTLLKQSKDDTIKNYQKKSCENEKNTQNGIFMIALREEWTIFKASFSNPIVLKNCIWCIFGMAANFEILSNMNVLYSYIAQISTNNQNVSSNGLAEAMFTLSGAAGAYLMGRVKFDWSRYGDLFTAVSSTTMGVIILSYYFYSQLYLVYLSNMLYGIIFQAQFVMVYTEIAKHLTTRFYCLVLVFSYIASSTVLNITTLFLIQFNFMGITIAGRYLFFGGQFIILGILYFFISKFGFVKTETFH